MNVRQIKAITWLGALGLGGYLGWTIYGFVQERPLLAAGIDEDTQRNLLNAVEAPPPPAEDSVGYDVVALAFQKMNWPGAPPEIQVVEGPEEDEGPKHQYKPVSDLLQVKYLQVDRGGDRSLAWVNYLDPNLIQAATKYEDKILSIGDTLASPWDGVTVADITPEGVVFSFASEEGDEPRENEVVEASVFERTSMIVVVGEDGVIEPQRASSIENAGPIAWNPLVTTQTRKDEYTLGTESLEEIEQNYAQILTRDIDYQAYRDPKTRKITGIEITKVREGSLPAQHGLQEGEVLKSINGHTVTSVSDATNYVKQNADTTDIWVAVFERRGREYTRTYRSPPE